MEHTLGIIKPDAVKAKVIGKILDMIIQAGLDVVAMKMMHLTLAEAEGFYAVHRERPFFPSLTRFMSEGPVVLLVLRGENAIQRWRDLMGPTNPAQAEKGTVRKAFGTSIERNAAHGSDSPQSAAFEIPYFFSQLEITKE